MYRLLPAIVGECVLYALLVITIECFSLTCIYRLKMGMSILINFCLLSLIENLIASHPDDLIVWGGDFNIDFTRLSAHTSFLL